MCRENLQWHHTRNTLSKVAFSSLVLKCIHVDIWRLLTQCNLWIDPFIYPFPPEWTFMWFPIFVLHECCSEPPWTCRLGHMLGCGGYTSFVVSCHQQNRRGAISPWLANAWYVHAFYFWPIVQEWNHNRFNLHFPDPQWKGGSVSSHVY